jgi:hypothetical protein
MTETWQWYMIQCTGLPSKTVVPKWHPAGLPMCSMECGSYGVSTQFPASDKPICRHTEMPREEFSLCEPVVIAMSNFCRIHASRT